MSTKITTELIKELRETTGISVMQCKRALEEADGDMEKAIAILKKNSSDIANKKADKEVSEGAIMVKSGANKLAAVTLLCETDFVSKNSDFLSLLNSLVDIVMTDGTEGVQAKATEMINPVIQKTGENIKLGEVYIIEGDVLGYYIHNNKSAVLVSLSGGDSELAKSIAMHITAMKPEYISKDEISEEAKSVITEVFEKEISTVDKPEEIKKKMLAGKLNTYFKEKTLLDQQFIKNPNETVGQLLDKAKAKIKEVKKCFI